MSVASGILRGSGDKDLIRDGHGFVGHVFEFRDFTLLSLTRLRG